MVGQIRRLWNRTFLSWLFFCPSGFCPLAQWHSRIGAREEHTASQNKGLCSTEWIKLLTSTTVWNQRAFYLQDLERTLERRRERLFVLFIYSFFKKIIYLRRSMHDWGEGQRERGFKQTPCWAWSGLHPTTCEIATWSETKNPILNQQSHPCLFYMSLRPAHCCLPLGGKQWEKRNINPPGKD